MPAPLSRDIRVRFRRLIKADLSGREAARQLMISSAAASRLARKVRTDLSLELAKLDRPIGSGKLEIYFRFFKELITQDADISLCELRDALFMARGVKVHLSLISNVMDLPRKSGGTSAKVATGGSHEATGANELYR
ncbi:hypothetical protein [Flexibacterium corallicola]|uniref:hypothetical protein n=1 Tax=Flexibacterium corallicola TaxID=3037259 RepID=UPI00286F4BCE|nr:hypothetical protein [Pseudovibrio sp. M1P-2-3]